MSFVLMIIIESAWTMLKLYANQFFLSLSLLLLFLLLSEDEQAQDEQNDSDDPVDVGAEEGTDELSWSEEVEKAADVKDSR